MIERYDLIVIGAGPAGLSAAIEAAKNGMKPIVFDENAKPGGQLFKQIHKFFGSKEHKAKIRGFNIGYELLEEANKLPYSGHPLPFFWTCYFWHFSIPRRSPSMCL